MLGVVPIRAVSFDLFDTLVDLELSGAPLQESLRALYVAIRTYTDLDFEAFCQVARRADRELRDSRYPQGLEISTEERFAHLLGRLGIERPSLVGTLTGIHMGIIQGRVDVPPHHGEVLGRVRARVRVALCSNFTHAATARRILDESALVAHLDTVVISVDVGLRKPRPEIFQAVLQGLGTAPEETLHVGDNLRDDVAGAAASGMRTAWLTRRIGDPEGALAGHEGPRPDFVIGDLGDVVELLED
jgi:FMN phosphatase YigB (HAD superfamily)